MDTGLHLKVKKYWRDYIIPPAGWLYQEITALGLGQRRVILVETPDRKVAAKASRIFSRHGISSMPAPNRLGSSIIGYRDPAAAEAFLEATAKGDTAGRGRLLGYPECCINFHLAERTDVNCLNTLRRSSRFSWLLNNISSEIRLCAHYPCRYDCAASVRLARGILGALRAEHGPRAAGDVERMLRHKTAYHEGYYFSFTALDAPFDQSPPLAAHFGLARGERVIVGKDGICAVSGRTRRTIAGKFLLFDFR